MAQLPSDLHRHFGLVAQIANGAQEIKGMVFGMKPQKNHDARLLANDA